MHRRCERAYYIHSLLINGGSGHGNWALQCLHHFRNELAFQHAARATMKQNNAVVQCVSQQVSVSRQTKHILRVAGAQLRHEAKVTVDVQLMAEKYRFSVVNDFSGLCDKNMHNR